MKKSLRRRLEILEVSYGKTRRAQAQLRYLRCATKDELIKTIVDAAHIADELDDAYLVDDVPYLPRDDSTKDDDQSNNVKIENNILIPIKMFTRSELEWMLHCFSPEDDVASQDEVQEEELKVKIS
jgi:hypothetical protein